MCRGLTTAPRNFVRGPSWRHMGHSPFLRLKLIYDAMARFRGSIHPAETRANRQRSVCNVVAHVGLGLDAVWLAARSRSPHCGGALATLEPANTPFLRPMAMPGIAPAIRESMSGPPSARKRASEAQRLVPLGDCSTIRRVSNLSTSWIYVEKQSFNRPTGSAEG